MVNERLLVSRIMSLVGSENLHLHTDGSMDTAGLRRQASVFSQAHIILGQFGNACCSLPLTMHLFRCAWCGVDQHDILACQRVCGRVPLAATN